MEAQNGPYVNDGLLEFRFRLRGLLFFLEQIFRIIIGR